MSQFAARRSPALAPCRRSSRVRPLAIASRLALGAAGAVLAVAGTAHAAAQPAGDAANPDGLPPVADLVAPADPFRLQLGYEWQDDTKFSNSQARIGVQRADVDFGYDTSIEGFGRLSLDFDYDLDVYDFKRTLPLAEGWEDVHQFAFSARFEADLDNEWVIFGGPVLRYAGESGADFGDALTGGGFAGLSWSPDSDLTLGFGIAAVTEIEDGSRFIPIILLDWEFLPGFSLRSTPTSFLTGATEVQVRWEIDRDFEASLGLVLNSERRFLLDDEGTVADAVAQEEGRWVYLRGTWTLAENTELTASIGLSLSPDFVLDDANGNELGKAGYDEVLSIGARLSLRF